MKKIAPDIYVSTTYPGVNVGFIILPAGVIAVDAPTLPQDAHDWKQQIEETAGRPILYVVLTDAHPDRLLSAGLLEAPIVACRAAYERAVAYTDGFWRGVIDGWARRYPQAADGLSETRIVLPEVMFSNRLTLHKGGADMTVWRVAGGAPGSAWIRLRQRNVLFAGDLLVTENHPFMSAAPDTKAWLNTLKSIRRPSFFDTIIVPGRGPLCDHSAAKSLGEYITLARRRARSLVGQTGMDKATAVADLSHLFPIPEGENSLVQRRIKAGLDRLCEELETQ